MDYNSRVKYFNIQLVDGEKIWPILNLEIHLSPAVTAFELTNCDSRFAIHFDYFR